MSAQGRVKSFNGAKGFGFIDCDFGQDRPCHRGLWGSLARKIAGSSQIKTVFSRFFSTPKVEPAQMSSFTSRTDWDSCVRKSSMENLL